MSLDTDLNRGAAITIVSQYRPAVPIPEAIYEHCKIYLDEQLYASALTLLSDLIIIGASHPGCASREVIAPNPFHVELISCLVIHPRYTTHAPVNESGDIASRSITFLRNLLSILGPVNAGLSDAFSLFPSTKTIRRRRNTSGMENGSSPSDSDREDSMRGLIANRGRIRRCAKDFWHIVGWALNCSIKCPKRWIYWKVYLDYMLDVLDADWHERERLDKDNGEYLLARMGDPDAECPFKLLRQCLLIQYLADAKGRSSSMKRVVRSAFANGTPESLREFPEVFPNETKDFNSQGRPKRKRGDRYGDYDEDGDTGFHSSDLADPMTDSSLEDDPDTFVIANNWLGGTESIGLRQRVLTLLSRVSAYFPDCFAEVREVYDAIYTCTRPLPLPAFSLLISPSNSQFPVFVCVSLSQLLLLRLLPNTAPRPQSVSKRDSDELTQDILERCFFPFTAMTSSIEDNAKVSFLAESLFRIFLKVCECSHTRSLKDAIETGIMAREKKVKGDKRLRENSKRNQAEERDMIWLKASGVRLRSLLLLTKMQNGNEE